MENTVNTATDTTNANRDDGSDDNAEHSNPGVGEYGESNESRTDENKGSTKDKLNRNNTIKRNIPKNQPISVIFNYSKVELTEAMRRLLNRGFNFSILPLKLDLTQVLVDFKRFQRSVIWHEYFYGSESDIKTSEKIFKVSKSNLPKNYTSPEGLKTYLGSIKSELMDHRNRNNVQCNLPPDEIEALRELINLQKDKVIVIKPCDKGAGMMILDYPVYMRACYGENPE